MPPLTVFSTILLSEPLIYPYLAICAPYDFRFPMFHPHPLSVFTTFGVTAAVTGTRINMKLL